MSGEKTGRGLAAIASALLPGSGHLLLGRRRIAVVLFVVDGLILSSVVVGAVVFGVELAKAWVTPNALGGLLVINAGLLVYRGAATTDSFFSAKPNGWLNWPGGLLAGILVLAPHLVFGSVAVTQLDLINTVFAASEPQAALVVSTTTSVSLASDPVDTTTSSQPISSTTTEPAPRIWDGHERLNIMLLGSDAGVGRTGTRTDTIILVSLEPETGDVAMFSIPRNLTEAPLPEGMGLWGCSCFPDIITHLWANGEWYPEAFPGPQEPSINALKGALGLIFDVEVHYYAKVDLAGFVAVFDALGGVTIDVPKRIIDETYPHENGGTERIVFEEGVQHLDGHQALAYSRIRRHSGDFARMHRQRCVLGALASQTGLFDLIMGYRDFATAVKDHIETDIPLERLGDFVELIPKTDTDRMATLRITRSNYGASGHAGYQIYDLEQIRLDAHALMTDPHLVLASQDGAGLEATCDESFD